MSNAVIIKDAVKKYGDFIALKGVPKGIAQLGIERFHLIVEVSDACAMGIGIVRAAFALWLIVLLFGKGTNVRFTA